MLHAFVKLRVFTMLHVFTMLTVAVCSQSCVCSQYVACVHSVNCTCSCVFTVLHICVHNVYSYVFTMCSQTVGNVIKAIYCWEMERIPSIFIL